MIRRWFEFAVVVLWIAAAPAIASAQQGSGRGRAFAKQRGLPVRVIEAGTAERRVRREVVPLTSAEHYAEFQQTFGRAAGGLTLHYDGDTHMMLALDPGDIYLWGVNHRGESSYLSYGVFNPNGARTMAVRLDGVDHLHAWMASGAGVPLCRGNCMEWLPNAEVAPGEILFHRLGLRRSRDGRNMRAKIIYAANDRIDVIGVHVPNVEAFEAMSDADLLGRPPAGGVDDAAR